MVNFDTKDEPIMRQILGQIDPIIDTRLFCLQTSFFKLKVKLHAKAAMEEPKDQNPVTKLWTKVGKNALMVIRNLEFMRVAQIATTTMLGSVEDERTVSTPAFMKSKFRNRLKGHLKLNSQQFFTLQSFPFNFINNLYCDDCTVQGRGRWGQCVNPLFLS